MIQHPRSIQSRLWAFAVPLIAAGLIAILPNGANAANQMPQGGGVIYPAWTGEYWANPEMKGEPAWTRSDIRIRFDWEDWKPIIGVHAESVRDFPTDHFSVRWTGKIIARFDEEYTFKLESDEQARIRIKPEGTEKWETLIDAWKPHKRRIDSATLALKPGVSYDMIIDYAEGTGDAVCSLSWSSPSTPEETLDYVAGNSIHFMVPETLANLFSFSGKVRGSQRPAKSAEKQGNKADENGWPTEDFSGALIQGFSFYTGRGLIVFKGMADVSISNAKLEVDGKTYEMLPKGTGYDAAKNETRAFVVWTDTPNHTVTSVLAMKNTQRTPQSPNGSGVTDLEVLLPKHVNGTEPHEPGEIISQESRDAFLPVFSFRNQTTGLNDIVKWSERTLPSYSKIMGQIWRADMAYEKLILAANEIGRDLHLNYSGSCDEEFMNKLALLMKYGSDGVEPYTQPTPNPKWPPLAPNLRLYLEHGNEMGWSGIQPREWQNDYRRIRSEKGPVWQALNFDGRIEDEYAFGLMRYHAYRTAIMSENMRAVWGDAAMGETIRVCLFGQYERWFQNGMVQYLNDYFGNPEYHRPARKPSELLWGAGPAVYYGTHNNFMNGDELYLTDGRFEGARLAPGEAKLAPADAAWQFEGGAGVIGLDFARLEAIAKYTPAEPVKIKDRAAVGFQFTVGPQDIYVYDVGHTAQPGEKGKSISTIVKMDGEILFGYKPQPIDLGKLSAGQTGYQPLEYCGWATSDSSRLGVWRLHAGQTYAVITEVAGGEIPGPESRLTAGAGITIDGAVAAQGASVGKNGVSGGKLQKISGSGTGYPCVTFRYAFAQPVAEGIAVAPSDPMLDPTWRNGGKGKSQIPEFHRRITRAAFIAGKGRISQTFTLPEDGDYALVFTANEVSEKPGSRNGRHPFTIKIDGRQIWSAAVGLGRKPVGGVFQWGTEYLPLKAGKHTLEIATRDTDATKVVYFYAMHLGNLKDYYGGPGAPNFLGAGAATGGTDSRFAVVAQLTTAEAQLWGLVPYAYEGGTQAGGDWNGEHLLYADQFKWNHPMSKVADNQWAAYWHDFGGCNAMYYYPGFEYSNMFRAETYMPWSAAIDRAHTWVLEPEGPAAAPVTFDPSKDKHYQGEPASTWLGWAHPWVSDNAYNQTVHGGELKENQWKGFIFRTPKAGNYTITANTTAGGSVDLVVDDTLKRVSGTSGRPVVASVWLTQGVHAVRVVDTAGRFALQSVEVK